MMQAKSHKTSKIEKPKRRNLKMTMGTCYNNMTDRNPKVLERKRKKK